MGKLFSVEEKFNLVDEHWVCNDCLKRYRTKFAAGSHFHMSHTKSGEEHKKRLAKIDKSWNRGLTKNTDERVKKCGENLKKKFSQLKEQGVRIGHACSIESRKKISKTMVLRHKEGKAWNIGKSRWNNKPSYPEVFFMRVIENHFVNKKYTREFPLGKYSIDFAWPDIKLAIEIDGEQHNKPAQQQSDIRKDKFLAESGWKVLRIKWQEFFARPDKYISLAVAFVENN